MFRRHAAIVALCLLPGAAHADTSFNGYVSERLQLTVPSEFALISTRDVAIMQSLTEGNIQIRFRGMDDKLYLYSDTSAFLSFAGGYADAGLDDHRLRFVKEHDVANYRPFFVVSEAYGKYEFFEHLNLTVGKQRVVWGSGFAFNPTDVINPPRDPTDPNFQRAGAYLAKLEMPFEKFTVSALFSPKVLYSNAGLPYALFMYPGYAPSETVRNPTVFPDPRDSQPHYAVAGRLYVLFWETDINVWAVYSNLYNDVLENKPRVAFSFSRYFFKDYEFHVEALGQLGTGRTYINNNCVGDDNAFASCLIRKEAIANTNRKDSLQFYPRLLFGTRTMFKDDSTLSLEYLFQADGYSPEEFQDAARAQRRVGRLMRAGFTSQGATATNQSGSELPLRFSFDPMRRHYLILSYTKPTVMDDFAVQGTLINSLEDLSSTVSASVIWTAQQWLQLSLFGFLPLPSAGRLSSEVIPGDPLRKVANALGDKWGTLVPRGADVDGERYGEYDALLFRARVVGEMRIFF